MLNDVLDNGLDARDLLGRHTFIKLRRDFQPVLLLVSRTNGGDVAEASGLAFGISVVSG